jgi:hypothetical protein
MTLLASSYYDKQQHDFHKDSVRAVNSLYSMILLGNIYVYKQSSVTSKRWLDFMFQCFV